MNPAVSAVVRVRSTLLTGKRATRTATPLLPGFPFVPADPRQRRVGEQAVGNQAAAGAAGPLDAGQVESDPGVVGSPSGRGQAHLLVRPGLSTISHRIPNWG
jgi:hypothetical protein